MTLANSEGLFHQKKDFIQKHNFWRLKLVARALLPYQGRQQAKRRDKVIPCTSKFPLGEHERGANAEKQESINANDPDLHHQKSTWHHSFPSRESVEKI